MKIEQEIVKYLRENKVLLDDKVEMQIHFSDGRSVIVNDLMKGFTERFIKEGMYKKPWDIRDNY